MSTSQQITLDLSEWGEGFITFEPAGVWSIKLPPVAGHDLPKWRRVLLAVIEPATLQPVFGLETSGNAVQLDGDRHWRDQLTVGRPDGSFVEVVEGTTEFFGGRRGYGVLPKRINPIKRWLIQKIAGWRHSAVY